VKLTFERHGGIGGVVLRATFTADELTEPETEAITAARHRTAEHPPAPQPDRFEYHLDLPEGRVVIGEEELPDALRPLVTRLVQRARRPS
jgi:hypothetical protein